MSMTREEAIAVLEESKRQNEIMRDNPTTFWASYQIADGIKNTKRRIDALDAALTALRPVSREKVEKVFGVKWEEETYTTVSGRGRVIHSKKYTCSACGKANGRAKTNFCHHCGASQTDEAVEMVMERLGALKDGKGD